MLCCSKGPRDLSSKEYQFSLFLGMLAVTVKVGFSIVNCNCKHDNLYSIASSKLLLGCFTWLLTMQQNVKYQILKLINSAKSNALNYIGICICKNLLLIIV